MFRLLVFSMVAASVACSATAGAAAEDLLGGSDVGDCASVSVVETDAQDARADVYVVKESAVPPLPEEPTVDDLTPYLDEVVAKALAFAAGVSTANTGSVRVELVLPRVEDGPASGVRVTLLVNVADCVAV